MNAAKRQALERAGFETGTVQEFLGLSDAENRLVELKVRVRTAAKRRREAQEMTQASVAKLIRSSQSRIAKIEAGSADVSLELLFRYLFAVGGDVSDAVIEPTEEAPENARAKDEREVAPADPDPSVETKGPVRAGGGVPARDRAGRERRS